MDDIEQQLIPVVLYDYECFLYTRIDWSGKNNVSLTYALIFNKNDLTLVSVSSLRERSLDPSVPFRRKSFLYCRK